MSCPHNLQAPTSVARLNKREVIIMDKIAKGMSEAGQHPHECCTKRGNSEGLLRRMADSLKGAATKVSHVLMGRHETRSGSTR
jgi:hypothetical protein